MLTLMRLKQDLEFNRGLGDIIEVLKTSAIIQFRSFQLKEKPYDEFLKEIETCFSVLGSRFSVLASHPYLAEHKDLPSLLVVVTSDEGFLGELNTLLVNTALDQYKSPADEIIVLGERGAKYLEEMNRAFVWLPGISEEIKYSELEGLRDYIFNTYRKRFGRVLVIYPRFVSLTLQRIEIFQYLPYQLPAAENKSVSVLMQEALMGPRETKVLERLVELWAAFKILEIAWSSKQSEYAARIMHLEGSTQELMHLNEVISFNYFRLVHALRDKSIREISASKVLLEKKAS